MKFLNLTNTGELPRTAEEINSVVMREFGRSISEDIPFDQDEHTMGEIITRPEEFTDDPMPSGGEFYQLLAKSFGSARAARSVYFGLFRDQMAEYQVDNKISGLYDSVFESCGQSLTYKDISPNCKSLDCDHPVLREQVQPVRLFFESLAATGKYELKESVWIDDDESFEPTTLAEVERYAEECGYAWLSKTSTDWKEQESGGWRGRFVEKADPDKICLHLALRYTEPSEDVPSRNFELHHRDTDRYPWLASDKTQAGE